MDSWSMRKQNGQLEYKETGWIAEVLGNRMYSWSMRKQDEQLEYEETEWIAGV